jgi:WD40 repeat protein
MLWLGVSARGTGIELGGLQQVLKGSPVRIRQEAILEGHTDVIRNLAFSPDGKLLVSSSKDGSVRVWDIGERQQRHAMSGFESLGDFLPADFPEPIADVSWSPDGSHLAVAAPQGGVRLCDAAGKPMMTIESGGRRTRKVRFSVDGQRLLASFDNGYLFVWTRDGDEITRLAVEKRNITDFALSPEGDCLAAGDSIGDFWLWDALTWQLVHSGHATPEWQAKAAKRQDRWVRDLHFVADGSRLVLRAYVGRKGYETGAWDNMAWASDDDADARSARASRLTWVGPVGDQPQSASGLVASPDGQLLVGSNIPLGQTSLIDPYSLQTRTVLSDPKTPVDDLPLLRFSSDSRFLAAATLRGRVHIWDTVLPYLGYDLAAHTELWDTAELGVDTAGQDDMGEPPLFPCTALAWSPDGSYLATAGIDQIERKPYRWYVANERRTIKLWAIDYNAY